MSSHEIEQKTSFVSLLAVILGFGGFATSLISLCMGWLIPSTKAKMPPLDELRRRSGHHMRSFSSNYPHQRHPAVTLRRHSSFHTGPMFLNSPLCGNLKHARRVSFDFGAPKYFSTPKILWRKPLSPPCPYGRKDLVQTNDSSPRSSEESATLLHTPPPNSGNCLPVRCYNAKCDCHSCGSVTSLEPDVRPAFSFPSLSRPLLGKRLPSMRNAFRSKRRKSSSASATTMTEVESSMRNDLLRSSIDSPNVTTANVEQSDNRHWTDGNTSGESYRPAFIRPFMPNRSKTISLPPLVDQEAGTGRKSSIGFSNPWLTSRSHSVISENPPVSHVPLSPHQSPAQAFIRRFTSSKPNSPSLAGVPDTSYFPIKRTNSVQQPKVCRTEPYGPPYNVPMPSQYMSSTCVKESRHTHTGSDSGLIVEKKSKKSRGSKPRRPATGDSRQYPQDDLVDALNEKLSTLQNAQAFGRDSVPRYIIASECDASPDDLRCPELHATKTSWGASVKRQVGSDSRSMFR